VFLRWFILITLCGQMVAVSQEQRHALKFSELESFLKINSPQALLLQQDLQRTERDRDIDLQWSNPEIGFEMENVSDGTDRITEKTVSLEKNIEFPWIQAKRRQIWRAKVQSANSLYQEQWRAFVADMRSGYVELDALDKQDRLLVSLKDILGTTSQVVKERYHEGTISGLDHNLLQMVLLNTESATIELMKYRLQHENEWKIKAGIDIEQEVKRQTEIEFVPVLEEKIQTIVVDIDTIPGMAARYARHSASKADLSKEKMNLMPEMTLAGGYKEISQNFKGFVIGMSMPLPLLNLNRPQVEKKRIDLSSQQTDLQMYRKQLAGEIKINRQLIFNYQVLLKKMTERYAEEGNNLQQIISAYREGWISLTEMINAVQIYYQFVTSYHQQLVQYYRTVFQLEAITGQKYVLIN
jgi:outer membrane protein TolC